MRYIILFIFFNTFFIDCYAQKKEENLNEKLFKQINNFVAKSSNPDVIKDSVAIYALNFKLEIVKDVKNEIRVNQIVANDSLAYKILPEYMKLGMLDYSSIIKKNRKITLIIPILVFNLSSKNSRYKKDNGEPLIDVMAAVNATYALSSSMPYSNIKEAEEAIGHRIYKFDQKNTTFSNKFENVILLAPSVI